VAEDGTYEWGEMAPGTYATQRFEPYLTFEVGSDWLGIDDARALQLTRDDGYFTFVILHHYDGRVIADRCTMPETISQVEGIDALVDWVLAPHHSTSTGRRSYHPTSAAVAGGR
jgi:hypothetical protein